MEIGDYSAQGYAIGLSEGLRDTTRVWESVIEDTKETLDMHSPSKKFEEICKGTGQGIRRRCKTQHRSHSATRHGLQ